MKTMWAAIKKHHVPRPSSLIQINRLPPVSRGNSWRCLALSITFVDVTVDIGKSLSVRVHDLEAAV